MKSLLQNNLFVGVFMLAGLAPLQAGAVMQSLNGLTGSNQTFANDTNVTISSSGSTHTLGWSGILSFLRGGTGTSTFANGGLVFSDGTKLTQNHSKLFWDNTNGFLGIGTTTPQAGLHVASGNLIVDGDEPSYISGGGNGAYSKFHSIMVRQTFVLLNNGDIEFRNTAGNTLGHIYSLASSTFGFQQEDALSVTGFLDFTQLTSADKNYVFPDYSGTISLLQMNQTWTGLNKFEASTNSTVYIGYAIKSGCLVMGDTDEDGVTYITANKGVITATTSQPNNCQ